jgi:hypothetical protein
MTRRNKTREPPTRLVARRRIWAFGAVAVVAIAAFGALGVRPLIGGQNDDRRVSQTIRVLQQIGDLRNSITAWQLYIQPHFSDFSAAPAKIDVTELAKGAILAQTQSTKALALIATLKSDGFDTTARQVSSANTEYTASIGKLAQLDRGAPPGTIVATLAAESTTSSRGTRTARPSPDY